jgi:hypothetical protein
MNIDAYTHLNVHSDSADCDSNGADCKLATAATAATATVSHLTTAQKLK